MAFHSRCFYIVFFCSIPVGHPGEEGQKGKQGDQGQKGFKGDKGPTVGREMIDFRIDESFYLKHANCLLRVERVKRVYVDPLA